ncbi:hypothetical protein CcaCcLH18_10105 [Colletotrichum camelliae]|nr:hypothetical protein CcaCcLH18_10105 [Colletotrichum camelliae]
MAPPRTRLTDAEWNRHKPYIRRMIIDQNVSQEEARQRLKDGGVLVTKAQLEYKLKIWGFRKKAPKEKSNVIWQFIGHRVEKRKQQQKASDVLLNGQLVDPAKVRKEINRHQPTSLVRLNRAGMSPKTPESTEVIIRTPASTPMLSLWPSCLPWLQFQRILPLSFVVPQLSKVVDHTPIHYAAKRNIALLDSLSHVIGDSNIKNISSLAAGLNILMPETYQGENRGRARLLLHGSAKEALTEQLSLLFYQLSNNMGDMDIDDNQWLSIATMLEESGMTKMSLQLGETKDATLLSVTENLFQQALKHLWNEHLDNAWFEGFLNGRSTDLGLETYEEEYKQWETDILTKLSSWRIINCLLSCGQDPNVPIHFEADEVDDEEVCLTPLQLAAEMFCPHLVLRLLDANADPTLVFDKPNPFIEIFLCRDYIGCTDKRILLERLLEHRACVSLSKGEQRVSFLTAAIEGLFGNFEDSESELLDMLIGNDPESCAKYRTRSPIRWITRTCSVLGYAVLKHSENLAMRCLSHLLERISPSEPFVLPAQFITPDVVLFAASRGHNKILDLLQELKVDFTLCGYRGITALHVAAHYGHLETCKRLLELGAPVDGHPDFQHLPSPLHLAAFNNKLETIELLHEYGAQLMKGITEYESQHWSNHVKHFENEGAKNPFGAALLRGNRQVCEYFAQQGVPCQPSAAYYEASRPCPQSEVVQLALRLGVDPNWKGDNGFSALQVALQQQDDMSVIMKVQTAMTLLDAGAVLNGGEISEAILLNDWNLTNRLLEMHLQGIGHRRESVSALEVAIASGNQHLITQTLTQYPGIYDAGALCSSVLFEDHALTTVKYLLDIRPHLQHVIPLESLAIGIAAWRDRGDLLELLLTKFREPSTATLPEYMLQSHDHEYLNTALKTAKSRRVIFWRRYIQTPISPLSLVLMTTKSLSRLLDHGFLPDRPTMSIAVEIGHDGPIGMLSGYPMLSPSFEDYEGPLTVAVRRNDINSPAARSRGATALQLASIKGYLGAAKMLVDRGADVNAPGATDEGGRTALEGAAEHGRIDTIQYLLSQGVQTHAEGRLSYLRAIRYAELEGHKVAANLIKKWREWTTKDDALWDELESLSKDECEYFIMEDFEDQSDPETELERYSPEKDNEGDVMQDLVFDDAPVAEAHTHEISITANHAGGIISELEDLEMMTNDTFAFWSGQ